MAALGCSRLEAVPMSTVAPLAARAYSLWEAVLGSTMRAERELSPTEDSQRVEGAPVGLSLERAERTPMGTEFRLRQATMLEAAMPVISRETSMSPVPFSPAPRT